MLFDDGSAHRIEGRNAVNDKLEKCGKTRQGSKLQIGHRLGAALCPPQTSYRLASQLLFSVFTCPSIELGSTFSSLSRAILVHPCRSDSRDPSSAKPLFTLRRVSPPSSVFFPLSARFFPITHRVSDAGHAFLPRPCSRSCLPDRHCLTHAVCPRFPCTPSRRAGGDLLAAGVCSQRVYRRREGIRKRPWAANG